MTTNRRTAAKIYEVVNPATGKVESRHEGHSPTKVEEILSQASQAFQMWGHTTFAQRSELMHAAARELRTGIDEHAALITREMGKPITQARAEIEKCAWVCDYFAEHAEAFLAPEVVETDATRSYVRFDPIGAVLAVMPWNFPFWQVFRFIAPTLMAGNVGLLKHASNVPGCAMEIERVMRRAGFPEGVFTTLLVGSESVEDIVRDPRIAAVTLTGSERAGSSVASIAGSEIKPSVLELGGSDPFVILADADLEAALDAAMSARTINSGQSCIAAKRFIVEAPLYERGVEGLRDRLAACRVGDPTDERCDVGPLARADLVDSLDRQVQASVADGARLVLGGEIPEGPGLFYPTTLLADCVPETTAFREETFGPVAAIACAEDAGDAIRLANSTSFGLGASLWTRFERADELAPQIAAGHVAVNGIVKSDPRLPFGGVKRSGYGRELSRYGILEFVNIKTVWIS